MQRLIDRRVPGIECDRKRASGVLGVVALRDDGVGSVNQVGGNDDSRLYVGGGSLGRSAGCEGCEDQRAPHCPTVVVTSCAGIPGSFHVPRASENFAFAARPRIFAHHRSAYFCGSAPTISVASC